MTQQAIALHSPSQNSNAKPSHPQSRTKTYISKAFFFFTCATSPSLLHKPNKNLYFHLLGFSSYFYATSPSLLCKPNKNSHLHLLSFSFYFYTSYQEDLVCLIVKWVTSLAKIIMVILNVQL